MAATKRDPDPELLQAALEWSWIVPWQVTRLHEAEEEALRSEDEWSGRPGVRHEMRHNHPFFRLSADRTFLLIAARNLDRALKALDAGIAGLPASLGEQVLLLRNCLEHFDEPGGRANTEFRKTHVGSPSDHTWGAGGTRLGGSVPADELASAAERIHAELLELADSQ